MALQKEVWLPSLKDDYLNESEGDFLSNAQDYSAFVDDNQVLHLAEVDVDDSEVYKNRKTDINPVEPSETDNAVSLDTYDSQTYKLRSIDLAALPYDKIAYYTGRGASKIRERELLESAHAFAPDAEGTKKVIIVATGEVVGGIRMITTKDVMSYATALDNAKYPKKGRHLVLPSTLYWALVDDNPVLKAQLGFQGKIGEYNPKVLELFDIKIHMYNYCPVYNFAGKAKQAFATAQDIAGGLVMGAFGFVEKEAFFASGRFEMFFKDKKTNTSGRAYEIGFQHRFKSGLDRKAFKYSSAILPEVVSAD